MKAPRAPRKQTHPHDPTVGGKHLHCAVRGETEARGVLHTGVVPIPVGFAVLDTVVEKARNYLPRDQFAAALG